MHEDGIFLRIRSLCDIIKKRERAKKMQELRKDALLKLFGGILCIVAVITFILCWNHFDWSFFDVCRFFLIAGAVVVGVWLGYMLILFCVLCFSELILYYIFLFSVDDLRFFNYIMSEKLKLVEYRMIFSKDEKELFEEEFIDYLNYHKKTKMFYQITLKKFQ